MDNEILTISPAETTHNLTSIQAINCLHQNSSLTHVQLSKTIQIPQETFHFSPIFFIIFPPHQNSSKQNKRSSLQSMDREKASSILRKV
jgi:hypothetical protein